MMRSINQEDFTFQNNCCRLASATHMAFNNIVDEEIDTDDISHFVLNEYGRPLGQQGSPVKAGVNVMIPYIKKRYNKDGTYRVIRLLGKHFNNLLDNGKLLSVNISITDGYNKLRKSGKKIEGDVTGKELGGHWFCLFRKDGKDYILNSGDPKYNIREIDLNIKGLFKGTKAYILY